MPPNTQWLLLPAIVMTAPSAYATDYFSLDQVQKALFADATEFRPRPITLSDVQATAISKASDTRILHNKLNVWEARKNDALLGYVVVDEVYGKHEFITYAVALSPDGKAQGIQIMTYNESYGDQIRDAAWRAQFNGKKAGDALKINADIDNIGGATLSCVHITEGVRRVLATYETAIKPSV